MSLSFYYVKKSDPLCGRITVSGAKNAALPAIAATLLTDDTCTLSRIPNLSDISVMTDIVSFLGADIQNTKKGVFEITPNIKRITAPQELCGRLRASSLFMGPLLAKYKRAKIPLPGGCSIGSRPIDLHLKGFAAMGADITVSHGFVSVSAPRLSGADIYLDFPSVGATENIMMAATLADGKTVIENAAAEPEISDLAAMLRKMGAKISGAGSDKILIEGTYSLHSCNHKIIPDRIEAGTFMTAAAMTNGKITLCGVSPSHLRPFSAKLCEMGAEISEGTNEISVDCGRRMSSCSIKTLPYPGFPTDMQAQFCALLSTVPGTGIITETVFENRFLHIDELCRMGADIKTDGRSAVIRGGRLTGANVKATDLRAGAALTLAGLAASGETEVSEIEHIERGYEDFPEKLRALGANIEKNET
ncbi:MAG: UDP-N-acetylglucosamine 1-carboxyvinyltransferase [Clostridia bacterium]|nr:UDP-N-acetylglucosamine 1-carboxyvinyltransferase [Clostridia bacterium]